MKKTLVILLFVIAGGSISASGSYLGDVGNVIVTPSRRKTEVYRWPGSVTVLTARDLAEIGAATVDEALSGVLGVSVSNLTGTTGRSTVDIRGTGENAHLRTLVLVDGRRANRPDMGGTNWLEIPLGSVERIEVVRGPGAVMYGSNAAGGVINIITRRPENDKSVSLENTSGSWGIFGQRLDYQYGHGAAGVYLGAERLTESGYRGRSGALSEGVSLTLDGSDLPLGMSATVRASANRSFYEMPGALTAEELDEDRRQAKYTDWSDWLNPVRLNNNGDEAAETRGEVSAEFSAPLSDAVVIRLHGGYSGRSEQVDMLSYNPEFFADRNMSTLFVSPVIEAGTNRLFSGARIAAGADFHFHELRVERFASAERDSLSGAADIRMPVYGLYAHGEIEPLRRLIFSGGYRAERAGITAKQDTGEADGSKKHSGNAVTAGVVYLPFPGVKAYANYGTHYRYPAADEQASYYGIATDGFFAGLDPESGSSAEVGLTLSVGAAVLDVAAYRMYIKNMIDWDWGLFRNVNMDASRRDGLEAGLRVRPLEWLSLRIGASLGETVFVEGDYSGNRMPLVPSARYNMEAVARINPALTLRADAVHTGARFGGGDFLNADEKLPQYTVSGIGCGISLTENAEVRFGIKNLLNELYSVSSWGGWYPASGRSFYVTARIGY